MVVVLCAANSEAGTIKNLIGSLDPNQLWSDNSGDYLADFAGGATTLDIGDVLVGQFSINTIEEYVLGNPAVAVPGAIGQEFTGAFAIEVVSKFGGGGGPATFGFGVVSAAKVAFLPVAVAAEVATWSAGTMAVFYQDPLLDYTRLDPLATGTIDSAFATAVNGTRLFEMGFKGLVGEGWSAFSVTDDIGAIGLIPAPSVGGFFNVGVNKTAGDPDIVFGKVASGFGPPGSTVDMSASGSLLGRGGAATSYDSFDNVDFTVNVNVVPEPGSMAIFGLLGCTLVATRFRRKSAA